MCLSLSVFFSLQFSVNASVQDQKPDPTPEATATTNPTPTPTNQTVDVSSSTPAPSPTETPHLITEEEALAMATPLIEQYASENNRTITSIKATFNPSMKDLEGSRGGLSTPEVLNLNLSVAQAQTKFSSYPVWTVEASFEWKKPEIIPTYDENGTLSGGHWSSDSNWIYGFTVGIWADTHQIFYSEPQGLM